MDTSLHQSAEVPPPPRAAGCGCCAAGCGTMMIVALAGLALVLGLLWYAYTRVVDAVTEASPTTVQLEEPNEAQFAAANEKMRRLEEAAATEQEVTVEFTAEDLNAIIARHPDYTDLRGKARVAIADSIATLELSVPLRKVPLPRVRQRWFNGTASFGLTYDENGFTFSPREIIANNYAIADDFFQDLAPTFNSYFNQEWDRSDQERRSGRDIWPQVRSLKIVEDKLVITTKGPAAASATSPAPTPEEEPALEPEQ